MDIRNAEMVESKQDAELTSKAFGGEWEEIVETPIDSNEEDLQTQLSKVPAEQVEEISTQQLESTTPDADMRVSELNQHYAWIRSSAEIFRFSHRDFIKPNKFHLEHSNDIVEADVLGKLKAARMSEAWLRSRHRRSHDGIVYAPGEPQIINNFVNLWQGWGCKPRAGVIDPWSELLDYVFANDIEHREWFEKWVAYPIQKPSTKLNTAVVLWSAAQGVGKTLLGQTIGRIYGNNNYKEITSNELRGRFNGWTKSCQFVLGEENSGVSRLTDSDRLKHLITGETIQVEEKYQPLIMIRNCINFLFTSNHADAFALESFDRRYFVWEIQSQPMSMAFYADFVDWRDRRGGAEALMHHFCNLDLSGFDPKGHAPMTAAKTAMIDASRSDLEQWLGGLRDDPNLSLTTLGGEVITLEKLVENYNLRTKSRAKPLDAGKALQRLGRCEKRRIQMGTGNRLILHAISRVEHWAELDNSVWIDEAQKSQG